MHTLWFGKSIDESIDTPRLHHQLEPNEILYESEFPEVGNGEVFESFPDIHDITCFSAIYYYQKCVFILNE